MKAATRADAASRDGRWTAFGRGRLRLAVVAAALLGIAIVWAVSSTVGSRRTDSTDRLLRRVVDTAQVTFDERTLAADRRASTLAGIRSVQQALADRDTAALGRIADRTPGTGFIVGGRTVGTLQATSARRAVRVYASGKEVGTVVATVPLDESFLRAVRSRSGLGDTGLLAIARGTTVTAGPATGTELRVRTGQPTTERALGRRYRALSTTLVGGPSALSFVALAPAAPGGGWIVLLEIALLVLALAAAATALLGGRGRASPTAAPAATVRDAVALVGDTLAATHNPEALLPVILAAAIEASGAIGGELLEDGRLVSRKGTIDAAARPLSADLGDAAGRGIRLLLWPPADGFSSEAEEAAAWFAEQATIALENARLHRIVEHQAVTDALTELANRRSFIDRLATEIGRAERFGSPLTLVLADLDDFKRINDRFGHMTGDDVLVAFARILRASVREIDLPVRLGGEEFALVLPDTDLAGGVRLAERLRLTLAQSRIPTESESVRVTASFGVASHAPNGTGDDLLAEADTQLYRAKQLGKNIVVSAEHRGAGRI